MNIIIRPESSPGRGGRRSEGDRLGNKTPRRSWPSSCKEEARKTDVMHPLKVLLYATFRNIPVHPMPQNHRPAFVRRVKEPGFKFRALLPAAARKQRQNSREA